jgi:two-component system sensor histidine kinase YesM
MLWIEVSDNGIGFPESLLNKLKEGTYENEVFEDGHLGIQNVMQRHRIRYNGKAKLLFSNGANKGAEIKIGIPLSFEDEEEDDNV